MTTAAICVQIASKINFPRLRMTEKIAHFCVYTTLPTHRFGPQNTKEAM